MKEVNSHWQSPEKASKKSPPPPGPPPPPPNHGMFKDYKLAIHYPISYCLTKSPPCSLKNLPQRFTIHGLWPQAIPGQKIVCSEEKLDPKVPPTITNLRKNWINANDQSSPRETEKWIDFIRHEWKEHGTCTGLSQREYFERALELYERVTMQLPKFATPGKYVNVTVLGEQLAAQKLGKPGTYCRQDVRIKDRNRILLVELRFIVSRDFNTFGISSYTDCNPASSMSELPVN